MKTTATLIETLKAAYSNLPLTLALNAQIRALVETLDNAQLKEIAAAGIKYVSAAANITLHRRIGAIK